MEILDNAVAVWAERSPEVPLGNWEGGENDETRSQKTCFDCISVLRVTAKEMCRKRAIQELIIPVRGMLFWTDICRLWAAFLFHRKVCSVK